MLLMIMMIMMMMMMMLLSQTARNALKLQLTAGGAGAAGHRRGGDEHVGLLHSQGVNMLQKL